MLISFKSSINIRRPALLTVLYFIGERSTPGNASNVFFAINRYLHLQVPCRRDRTVHRHVVINHLEQHPPIGLFHHCCNFDIRSCRCEACQARPRLSCTLPATRSRSLRKSGSMRFRV
jgi:hypothetical protein